MAEISGAQAVVETLRQEHVKYVFGMPGGANLPIYDALLDSDIRHILVRHEQSAAHMADAFGRVSGRAGVCMGTSGPGATNLVTGIATAYADSSPVVAITGQVPKAMTGRNAFQETDVIGVMTPITKYSIQPLSAEEIPSGIKKAFYIATSGRPGPVLVDIPKDVQQEVRDIRFPESVEVKGYRPYVEVDPAAIERAASPCALKRFTNLPTPFPLFNPAVWAASVKGCPAATASNALALRTTSSRSLVALTMRCNSRSSCSLTARNGAFWGCTIDVLLLSLPSLPLPHSSREAMVIGAGERATSQSSTGLLHKPSGRAT